MHISTTAKHMTSDMTTSTQPDTSSGWGLGQDSTMEQQTVDASSDGCLLSEQGEFFPWDNPDNIISKEVVCYPFEVGCTWHTEKGD